MLTAAAPLPPQRSRFDWKLAFLRVGLTAVFASSFFVYFVDYGPVQQALPVLLLWLLAAALFMASLLAPSSKIMSQLRISLPMLVLLSAMSIPFVMTLFSPSADLRMYSIALLVTVVATRIILSAISLADVMGSFFWAGVLSAAGFVWAGYSFVADSVTGDARLNILNFHPNLIGFIFVAYFSVSAFIALYSQSKVVRMVAASFAVSSLAIIFFASSRGSLVAAMAALVTTAVLLLWKSLTWHKLLSLIGWAIVGLCAFTAAVGVLYLVAPYQIEGAASYIDRVLQVTNVYRGLGSGLSGRLDNWHATISAIHGVHWITGYGFRTSSTQLTFPIDNGYLTLLYEAGLVCALAVVFAYFRSAHLLLHQYSFEITRHQLLVCLGGLAFLAAFLANNVVARFLLGIGNPVSLLAVFFLVLQRRDLIHLAGRIARH